MIIFLRRKFIDDKRTINFEKKGHRVLVRNILYKHLNKRQEQNNFSLMTDAFSNQIVIFDEVHRLFRINKTTMESYLKQYIENRFLKNSKRYITMTGTPINKSLDDVVEMLDFVQSAGQPNNFTLTHRDFSSKEKFSALYRGSRGYQVWYKKYLSQFYWYVGFGLSPIFRAGEFYQDRKDSWKQYYFDQEKIRDRFAILSPRNWGDCIKEYMGWSDRRARITYKEAKKIFIGGAARLVELGAFKTPYQILELDEGEKDEKKLKKAYNKFRKKYHPDHCERKTNLTEEECKIRFEEGEKAYKRITSNILKFTVEFTHEETILYLKMMDDQFNNSDFLRNTEMEKHFADLINNMEAIDICEMLDFGMKEIKKDIRKMTVFKENSNEADILKSFENIEKENIKINNEIGDADKFKGYKKNFQIKMLEYKKTYKEIQDNRKLILSIGYKKPSLAIEQKGGFLSEAVTGGKQVADWIGVPYESM